MHTNPGLLYLLAREREQAPDRRHRTARLPRWRTRRRRAGHPPGA